MAIIKTQPVDTVKPYPSYGVQRRGFRRVGTRVEKRTLRPIEGNVIALYDESVGGTSPVTGRTAELRFIKTSNATKVFSLRRRAGVNSDDDNVIELFAEADAANSRFNTIFIGRQGDNTQTVRNGFVLLAANLDSSKSSNILNGAIELQVTKNGVANDNSVCVAFSVADSRLLTYPPYTFTDGLTTLVLGRDDGMAALGISISALGVAAISLYVKNIAGVGNGYPGVAGDTFIPEADNSYDLGKPTYRWADLNTVKINGATPLPGTKVYYVADTSGGAVTRKLTFIGGILTAET